MTVAPAEIFKAYDVRGLYGEQIDGDVAEAVGRAFARVSLLVDTSVWSLALRRDAPPDVAEVRGLRDALAGGEIVATTGVILQELLQGVVPERARTQIIEISVHWSTSRPLAKIMSLRRACATRCDPQVFRSARSMPSLPSWPSLAVMRSLPRTTTSAPHPATSAFSYGAPRNPAAPSAQGQAL